MQNETQADTQPAALELGLVPDLNEAKTFLNCLDKDAQSFTFQTFDDNKERSVRNKKTLKYDPYAKTINGSLEESAIALFELQRQGAGVFVTINETDGTGRKAENITRVRSVFVDLDGAPLVPILEAKAPPHIIVESSPQRWHAYWLVNSVLLGDFKAAQQALSAKFNADPSVCDLPRVLRLPGFWHLKGEPFQTRIVSNAFSLDEVLK